MPVVLVHGVRERNADYWPGIDRFLREYALPAISDRPESVPIERVYWGDLGTSFRWGGISRPRSAITGMGVDDASLARAVGAASVRDALNDLPAAEPAPAGTGVLTPMGPGASPDASEAPMRLETLTGDQLSALLAAVIAGMDVDAEDRAAIIIAADRVARDPATIDALRTETDADRQVDLLIGRVEDAHAAMATEGDLVSMGAGDLFRRIKDDVRETLTRGANLPGWVVTRLLTELRAPMNTTITEFIGDVFAYLDSRGTREAAGPIPQRLLAALATAKARQAERGGEPIVVLSHSMGGQLVYDAVTTWLPAMDPVERPRIDFWCAAASQVGLFEEMGRFLASDPAKYGTTPGDGRAPVVPRPDRAVLGGWWNVWDQNDFISFTARKIIDGVDDGEWDSGAWFPMSHGAYFQNPSFFRALGDRLEAGDGADWWR